VPITVFRFSKQLSAALRFKAALLSAAMLAGYKIAPPGRYRPPARMGCDYQQTFSLTLAISAISASYMRSRIMPYPATASLGSMRNRSKQAASFF
jgi:hypothetical protein